MSCVATDTNNSLVQFPSWIFPSGNLRTQSSHHTRHQKYFAASALYLTSSVVFCGRATCCVCRCLLSSSIVATDKMYFHVFKTFVVSAAFVSVLLLKQILLAFCQISRHVSAVISTLKSFSCICLVACVITQVVAISADSNILKRNGCLCVFALQRMANKAQLGF